VREEQGPLLVTKAMQPIERLVDMSFAQKILGGHRPPLQLGVRDCRGAL